SNAPGLFDLKATPFTSQNIYPGMEIHATALENLINGDYLYRVPGWVVFLLMVLVAGGLSATDRLFQNLRVFIGIFIVVIIITVGAAYLIILRNVFFAAGEVLLTAGLVFAGLIVSGYFSESKDKRILRRQFERYVNDTVLEEILANPDAVDVKGRTVNATVMATDIADFTTISEQFPPHVVVSQLNDYLSEVSEALIDNGAFINKYIGDAILALFGAFGERDHRRNACLAALNATIIIQRQNEEAVREQRDPFVTRFGITSGELTIGNIGSARKTEFTVIGDSVNSAFRLEGLNKFYRTTILVSEHTREGAGDEFKFRLLDVLRYKGKLTPVKIYELMGFADGLSEERMQWRDEFEHTLTLYQNRDFERALTRFAELARAGDAPSEVFRIRCEQFIAKPPPPEWNGVWVMMRK
ncbi:adenylate/guanylate cyclase domain-containing protein, partial [Candidatus Latescibacterota bacterium]